MTHERTFALTNYYRRLIRMGDAELAASDPVKGAEIFSIRVDWATEYRARELKARI